MINKTQSLNKGSPSPVQLGCHTNNWSVVRYVQSALKGAADDRCLEWGGGEAYDKFTQVVTYKLSSDIRLGFQHALRVEKGISPAQHPVWAEARAHWGIHVDEPWRKSWTQDLTRADPQHLARATGRGCYLPFMSVTTPPIHTPPTPHQETLLKLLEKRAELPG